ncbi:hypothetical protein EUGRSUZ_H03811 [Eucalyptus grandis]|uniref:Uncharacterized protein n=2 Tax=Eucalyptus grandis TaxID=71139 RepID=A0ACC3JUX8_EUCGR|nr:hypothetical protein EUGRSUZ_H03811 [Eucalyptus grandis]
MRLKLWNQYEKNLMMALAGIRVTQIFLKNREHYELPCFAKKMKNKRVIFYMLKKESTYIVGISENW